MHEALTRQVGGNHYVLSAIQPYEFAMANGYDACAFAIFKYVYRHKRKNGLEDLRKAIHTVDVRAVLAQPSWKQRAFSIFNGGLVALLGYEPKAEEDPRISMERFIDANGVPEHDATALRHLDIWVRSKNAQLPNSIISLKSKINIIAVNTYGEDIS